MRILTHFTTTKVRILTLEALFAGVPVVLLPSDRMVGRVGAAAGAQFTCFTGTKVQILTQKAVVALAAGAGIGVARSLDDYLHIGTQFTCFTGTKVQILTEAAPASPRPRHQPAPPRGGS